MGSLFSNDFFNKVKRTLNVETKNYLVNGGFDFWQRGTSFSLSGTIYNYTADRFRLECSGSSIDGALSRSTDSPDSNIYPYSALVTQNGGSTATTGADSAITQAIESKFIRNMSGKNLVFSFWIKKSDLNESFVELRITRPSTGTDDWSGNGNGRIHIGTSIEGGQADITNQVTSDWQKITYKFQCPDFSTGDVGLSLSLVVGTREPTVEQGFYTTGWMLHEDTGQDIDVPFQRAGRNYAEELQLCQRYYEKSYALDTSPGTVTGTGAIGSRYGTTAETNTEPEGFAGKSFVVTKRTIPNIVCYSPTSGNAGFVEINNSDEPSSGGTGTESYFTLIVSYTFQANTSDVYQAHWTADAEI